jgi:hypothetical protein
VLPRLLVPVLAAAVLVALPAPAGAAQRGGVEHTVTSFTLERDGVVQRAERVETWRTGRRSKVVYSDGRTGAPRGACTGTRRRIRCVDRDPASEAGGTGDGRLLALPWAATGGDLRRALARGWLAETGPTVHRGTAARRFASTAKATGDAGETVIVATRDSLSLLFRQTRSRTPSGWVVATEDVLLRERLALRDVDFGLPPAR